MDNLDNISEIATEYFNRFIDYLPSIIGAIVIFLVGLWIIKILVRYLNKVFDKKGYDEALKSFVSSIVSVGLKLLLVIIVIAQLGIATTSLVAVMGAAGLAVGLALQGSLANFAGGVMIILLKPFRIGDWVEAQGVSGSVKEISIFYTKIVTFHNQLAVIPNGQLSNNKVVNYTVEGKRKDAITFRIAYDSDIKKAKEVLMDLMTKQEGTFKDPAPQVVVGELAPDWIALSARFVATTDDFWDVHWFTLENAPDRLKEAGIRIPFPQQDVHLYDKTEKK